MWKTYFELLNVPGLIRGKYERNEDYEITIVFFDPDGKELNRKHMKPGRDPRLSIPIDKNLYEEINQAATFSIFHVTKLTTMLGGSYLAERGYTGYKRIDLPIRGYVHGNLDSIAFGSNGLQMIGNAGLLKKYYQIQHPFKGPALYELFIVNPTQKDLKINVQVRNTNSKWVNYDTFHLKSRGSTKIPFKLDEETKFIRIKSKLYLGRPLVFRNTKNSMDVFHG